MREIGSEFWSVPTTKSENTLFSSNTKWFISGRSALKAIINELKGAVRTIAIPSWCCDSIIRPFIDAGITVSFYSVYSERGLVQDICFDCDALLVMDFFGYSGSGLDFSNYEGIVVRDVTHSLFSASYQDADFYFGSLRKWCGVWTGGFAWGRNIRETIHRAHCYESLRCSAMEEKASFIESSENGNKEYLRLYESAEIFLENCGILAAAPRDIELAGLLDVDYIRTQRRNNAMILMRAFRDMLIFPNLGPIDCPMFVPIIVPKGKRDELRKFLIEQSIYCPVHWPLSSYHKISSVDKSIYENELSLVCDQRYGIEDMQRIIDAVNDFGLGE